VVFNWPLTSDFFFRRAQAGGGVLIDTGVHTLDQLLWWLGDVSSLSYYDDNCGGVEADCELQLTLRSGAKGIVELSRTRNLRNTAIIRGERAELEVDLGRNAMTLRFTDSPVQVVGRGAGGAYPLTVEQTQIDIIADEHADFLQAIRTGQPPAVSGAEGKRSIALIEACYRERQPLRLPWTTMPTTAARR
jgi:predicted dehydrogenase